MIGPLRAAFHRRLRRRAGQLAGRIAPHLRRWLQGRVAFRLCAALRLIPLAPTPLRPRRMLSRKGVGELADEAGLKLARVVPEPGLLGLVSRDLFVLEGPPRGPCLAASPPRPGAQRP